MEKICERCGKPMKMVPAGFSKRRQKHYNAFYSCDQRNGGCGKTEQINGTKDYEAQKKLEDSCYVLKEEFEETISKIRTAFANLRADVNNIKTFQEGQNKEAAELHHSFKLPKSETMTAAEKAFGAEFKV